MLRTGNAQWEGGLKDGNGTLQLGNGAYNGPYSFGSRFEEGSGTNPEELVAAAHAACYSMALSATIEKNGYLPTSVKTKAEVTFEKLETGFRITRIHLEAEAVIAGIDDDEFQTLAITAKETCPISVALKSVQIDLTASLSSS